jgi:hypothetical protein
MRIAAWAGVATTIAVLTAGAIFGLAAQSRSDEISRRLSFVDATGQPHEFDATAQSDFKTLKDEGNLYNGLAIGFYSGAGALAVVTAVLFAVDAKHRSSPPRAAKLWKKITPTAGVGQVGLGWSF